jgi:hypothetical protein
MRMLTAFGSKMISPGVIAHQLANWSAALTRISLPLHNLVMERAQSSARYKRR